MYVIYVTIVVVVHMVVAAEIVFAMEVISVELGTSAAIPCDHVQNDSEVRLVQWYKGRNIDEFINGDSALAWWQDGMNGSIANYRLESRSFSLLIINSSLEGEGLYKCFVARGDLHEESNYFIRTVTYALPRKEPTMTLDLVENHVRCSVEHVKPLRYPVLNIPSDKPRADLNEDGTYTTSVGCTLPTDCARVECSFSFLHYYKSTSFSPHHNSTDEPTIKTTMPMSATATTTIPLGNGSGNVVITALSISVGVLSALLIVIIIVYTRYRVNLSRERYRDVQEISKIKESEIMIVAVEKPNLHVL